MGVDDLVPETLTVGTTTTSPFWRPPTIWVEELPTRPTWTEVIVVLPFWRSSTVEAAPDRPSKIEAARRGLEKISELKDQELLKAVRAVNRRQAGETARGIENADQEVTIGGVRVKRTH